MLPCNPKGIHYLNEYSNESFGYFVHKGIPHVILKDMHEYSEYLYCFYSAIYMCRKSFPTVGIPSIHFSKFKLVFQDCDLSMNSAIRHSQKY